jgi:hypothetical protein
LLTSRGDSWPVFSIESVGSDVGIRGIDAALVGFAANQSREA